MSEQLKTLAKQLVTPERFGGVALAGVDPEQPTEEIDYQAIVREIDTDVAAEKQRILDQRQEYRGE